MQPETPLRESHDVGIVLQHKIERLEQVEREKAAKGRRITPSGQRDLDRIAGRVKVPVA